MKNINRIRRVNNSIKVNRNKPQHYMKDETLLNELYNVGTKVLRRYNTSLLPDNKLLTSCGISYDENSYSRTNIGNSYKEVKIPYYINSSDIDDSIQDTIISLIDNNYKTLNKYKITRDNIIPFFVGCLKRVCRQGGINRQVKGNTAIKYDFDLLPYQLSVEQTVLSNITLDDIANKVSDKLIGLMQLLHKGWEWKDMVKLTGFSKSYVYNLRNQLQVEVSRKIPDYKSILSTEDIETVKLFISDFNTYDTSLNDIYTTETSGHKRLLYSFKNTYVKLWDNIASQDIEYLD